MKKVLGLGVVIIILSIAAVFYGVFKVILKDSQLVNIGALIYVLIELSPLLIGVYLAKLSWRKITTKKEEILW